MSLQFERGDHSEMADAICAMHSDPSPVHCGGRFWRYRDGIWHPDAGRKSDFAAEVFRAARGLAGAKVGDRALTVNAQTIEGVERIVRRSLQDEGYFDAAAAGVCAANGFVALDGDVTPHSPENRARFSVPCAYDPAATCPQFLAFLENLGLQPNEVACIQEFFGVALFGRGTKLQKTLILMGNGSNGRSTLAEILERFYHEPACLPPNQWGQRFLLVKLLGKTINIVHEMPSKALLAEESTLQKAVVVGNPVTVEEKGQPAFNFRPIASHVYLLQEALYTNDLSHGFWRRPMCIQFKRQIAEKDADRDIKDRICNAEAAGIFAWLVGGARRALARGRYVEPESHAELLAAWRLSCDVVDTYLTDVFDRSAERPPSAAPGLVPPPSRLHRLPGASLYKHFAQWCRDNGHTNPPANNKFGARLTALKVPSTSPQGRKFYGLAFRLADELEKFKFLNTTSSEPVQPWIGRDAA